MTTLRSLALTGMVLALFASGCGPGGLLGIAPPTTWRAVTDVPRGFARLRLRDAEHLLPIRSKDTTLVWSKGTGEYQGRTYRVLDLGKTVCGFETLPDADVPFAIQMSVRFSRTKDYSLDPDPHLFRRTQHGVLGFTVTETATGKVYREVTHDGLGFRSFLMAVGDMPMPTEADFAGRSAVTFPAQEADRHMVGRLAGVLEATDTAVSSPLTLEGFELDFSY